MKESGSTRGFSKGIAVHAVALVVIFGFMLFLIFMIFKGYLDIQNCEVLNAICASKKQSYCADWWYNDQTLNSGRPDWEDAKVCNELGEVIDDGCEEPSAQDCRDDLYR